MIYIPFKVHPNKLQMLLNVAIVLCVTVSTCKKYKLSQVMFNNELLIRKFLENQASILHSDGMPNAFACPCANSGFIVIV